MKGFTLIEVVIYIALLSLLLGGTVESTYSFLTYSASDERDIAVSQEGTFVLHKIEWALMSTSSASRIISPAKGSYADALSLIEQDGKRVDICKDGSTVRIREGSGVALPCSDPSYAPLTSAQGAASTLQFFYNPSGTIEASTTIGSDIFHTEVYVEE